MKTFKTPKGTELPLMDMRGKDYLQVAHRLVWMREEHPDWSIETEFLVINEKEAVAKATVRNESGRVLATSHKSETMKDFPAGHGEKAETGAIGRALALCGYGTQFAPEFDEAERVVDSPVVTKPSKPAKQIAPKDERAELFAEIAKHMSHYESLGKTIVSTMDTLFGAKSSKDLTNAQLKALRDVVVETVQGAAQ